MSSLSTLNGPELPHTAQELIIACCTYKLTQTVAIAEPCLRRVVPYGINERALEALDIEGCAQSVLVLLTSSHSGALMLLLAYLWTLDISCHGLMRLTVERPVKVKRTRAYCTVLYQFHGAFWKESCTATDGVQRAYYYT